MTITLEAIKFNHDPNSAAADAFNLRRNETDCVNVPEWRLGISLTPDDSPAAYAISEILGSGITIQAKFAREVSSTELEVRAIDPQGGHSRPGSSRYPFTSRNVLGGVKARWVSFPETGETAFETFELQGPMVEFAGISSSVTTWIWQFRKRPAEHWTDFAETKHRIYTVLKIPKSPWMQDPYTALNIQIPWTEALDYACYWAHGAKDPDEAASRLTCAVYNLGRNLVRYDVASSYSDLSFDCSSFLSLFRDDKGMGQVLNCQDCATIVSTFANILGCELWQSQIGSGQKFLTNPIKLIGARTSAPREFDYHEVAWKGACTKNEELFDACLEVDGDKDPTQGSFQALAVTDLRFGDWSDKQYRFRFAPAPNGKDHCIPRPDTRRRRILGLDTGTLSRANDDARIAKLREYYAFDSWQPLVNTVNQISLSRILPFTQKLNQWSLFRLRFLKDPVFACAFHSLWYLPNGDPEMLIRFDAYELHSAEEARIEMIRLLARFHTLEPSIKPEIRDQAIYIRILSSAILIVWGHYTIEIRSAGRKEISTRNFGTEIEQILMKFATQ